MLTELSNKKQYPIQALYCVARAHFFPLLEFPGSGSKKLAPTASQALNHRHRAEIGVSSQDGQRTDKF